MRLSSTTVQRLAPPVHGVDQARARVSRVERQRLLGMRVEDTLLDLRARGPLELLDLSFELLRRNFALFFGLGCMVWFPLRLLLSWVQEQNPLALALVNPLVVISGQLLLTTWLTVIARDRLRGEDAPGGVLRAAQVVLRRFPGLVGLSLLVAMLAGLAVCCLVVGSYIVQWLFALAPLVYVIEGRGFGASLSRSLSLVKGSFWRWLGWSLLVFLIAAPVVLLQTVLENPDFARMVQLDDLFPALADLWWRALITTLCAALYSAAQAMALALFYFDQRVRAEGLDFEMALEQAERRMAKAPGVA